MSLVESATNIVVGFVVATITNQIVLPLFGIEITLTKNMEITVVFTFVSLVRSYALRRFFNTFKNQPKPRRYGLGAIRHPGPQPLQ